MESGGIPIINLGIGNPDMAPSEETVERLADSARQTGHHGYQPYKGIAEFRKAIAAYYLRDYGVHLDPESELLPLLGSKEGVLYTSLAFVNPGEEVLIPDPGYPTYVSVSKMIGATIRPYELKEKSAWLPDLNELERGGLSRVRVMWVNYPHMPTGANPERVHLQTIVDFARRNNILIAFDNPYSHIIHEGTPQSILACTGGKDVAIELNSLSKSHNMAGWRVGWIAGNKEHINTVLRVVTNVESGMFLPLQHAAAAALGNPTAWYERQREEYRRRREWGEKIVHALGCTCSGGQVGMFVWARIPDAEPGAESFVEKVLRTRHVFLAPGHIFGRAGGRHVRLSLCSPEVTLQQAFSRVSGSADLPAAEGTAR